MQCQAPAVEPLATTEVHVPKVHPLSTTLRAFFWYCAVAVAEKERFVSVGKLCHYVTMTLVRGTRFAHIFHFESCDFV